MTTDRPHRMRIATPAMKWSDALPTGNGRVGGIKQGAELAYV